MRPPSIVLVPPTLDQHLGFLQLVEDLPIQELIPQLAVEALDVPVPWTASRAGSQGLPGSMNSVRVPSSLSQRRILWDVNSGPLSDRMNFGSPYSANSLSRRKGALSLAMMPGWVLASSC